MDDLELVVGDSELDQERQVGLVEEAFEVGERVVHLVGRRRDEDGVVERAAAEPDRASPQLAGAAVLAPRSVEEAFVHLPEEPDGDGEALTDASEPVLHRHDVVPHLRGGVGRFTWKYLPGLEAEQFAHIGLGPLDPGAQDCLETKVGSDEQVRIGDQAADAAEAVHCASRLIEELDDLVGQAESTRRFSRVERPVPLGSLPDAASLG